MNKYNFDSNFYEHFFEQIVFENKDFGSIFDNLAQMNEKDLANSYIFYYEFYHSLMNTNGNASVRVLINQLLYGCRLNEKFEFIYCDDFYFKYLFRYFPIVIKQ